MRLGDWKGLVIPGLLQCNVLKHLIGMRNKYSVLQYLHSLSYMYRAANRYEKIVFVTKFGREYENTKVHPKIMNVTAIHFRP